MRGPFPVSRAYGRGRGTLTGLGTKRSVKFFLFRNIKIFTKQKNKLVNLKRNNKITHIHFHKKKKKNNEKRENNIQIGKSDLLHVYRHDPITSF